ncbi:fasciclin domain-containing protein, partial [Okeania sp. SIO2G5]|uniref:fasciclin domain-containing protein n=1 Tax=Okeania sp. SIO2G5 TaxID=2607796 RepID=UPI0013C0D46F
FTVFAPTNDAFDALPEGTIEFLLMPENQATLQKVLTYHVVAGAVPSSAIQPGVVQTVEGNSVQLSVEDGIVMVDSATVIMPDVQTSNGVIHVIDKVLLPPEL